MLIPVKRSLLSTLRTFFRVRTAIPNSALVHQNASHRHRCVFTGTQKLMFFIIQINDQRLPFPLLSPSELHE